MDDPIITEVRKAGKEIAREADYDIHRLCELLRERERTSSVVVIDRRNKWDR
ncbi:MAG: hypothetical protein QGH39_05680 [Candidatus Thermoplasmatota archaeon]|jgi:hypothetical protein|nr:hypothetical protein [Candidatus Thermoplasmatota archaeon]MDP7265035.1 hypothetical protein [Candidatus Thermoplasmatota archaeon]